jgi:cation diffusion facilitator family transporter
MQHSLPHSPATPLPCSVRTPTHTRERERGVRAVVLLTFVMMLVEVVAGYLTGSMALLADGWHMATHVAALGLASAAYALSHRFAAHRAFALGTGKIHALAGYTSAVALGLVALVMMGEAASRLLNPASIDFEGSLPVAVLGLFVNLASYRLLHRSSDVAAGAHGEEHEHEHAEHEPDGAGHDAHAEHGHPTHAHEPDGAGHDPHAEHGHPAHAHEPDDAGHDPHAEHGHPTHAHGHPAHAGHGHGHEEHDHNHRAAVLHVAADALTSLLAIIALLAGKYAGYTWLDPVMGIVGGAVILKWGATLCRHAAFDLLNVELSPDLEDEVRATLEHIDDVRVSDLHVWSLGRGARGCVVTLSSGTPRGSVFYRERLARFGLAHLTVEVRRRGDGHAGSVESSDETGGRISRYPRF